MRAAGQGKDYDKPITVRSALIINVAYRVRAIPTSPVTLRACDKIQKLSLGR